MNEIIRDEIGRHRAMLDAFEAHGADTLEAAARVIVEALSGGGSVYLCGHGESAATAQHVAGELMGRFRANRAALPAVALSADTSTPAALGADFSFSNVFSRQVEALARKGDALWVFSTSSESPNVAHAVETAQRKGARVVTFVGRAGSTLAMCGPGCANADVCLCIDSPETSTVQEMHQLAYHIVCNLVEQAMGAIEEPKSD